MSSSVTILLLYMLLSLMSFVSDRLLFFLHSKYSWPGSFCQVSFYDSAHTESWMGTKRNTSEGFRYILWHDWSNPDWVFFCWTARLIISINFRGFSFCSTLFSIFGLPFRRVLFHRQHRLWYPSKFANYSLDCLPSGLDSWRIFHCW